jgi:predicted O-methyltransferase YrrM
MQYPNWFQSSTRNFQVVLDHYKNQPNLKFLQIGAYTGDASIWLLDNILTEPSSILIDVDTWAGSNEEIHKTFDWKDVESVYDQKISRFSNVKKYKGTSTEYLKSCNEKFDFIYIDGDHTAEGVYSDAALSLPLLKSGGILAFDDYLWKHDSQDPKLEPKAGIDRFVEENFDKIKVLINHYQYWLTSLK